jgi:hypothetical protein
LSRHAEKDPHLASPPHGISPLGVKVNSKGPYYEADSMIVKWEYRDVQSALAWSTLGLHHHL